MVLHHVAIARVVAWFVATSAWEIPHRSPDVVLNTPKTKSQARHIAGHLDTQNTNKASVPFLLNYSGSGNRHPGDVNRALSLLSTTETGEQAVDPALPSFNLEIDTGDIFFEDCWNVHFGSFEGNGMPQDLPLPAGLEDSHRRQMAATQMIDCVAKSQFQRRSAGINDKNFDFDEAERLFSEQRIYDYIKAYFDQIVRPRSRIVLKSTFHLKDVSVPLLLSLFLMGATCDTDECVKSQVVEYTEIAEYVIFESPVFRKMIYQRGESHWSSLAKEEIEIIQAAILMILMEIASPNAETRRRTRIQWYPAVVSVARATSLTKVRNEWHNVNGPISHDQFLKNELCVRYLYDAHLWRAVRFGC